MEKTLVERNLERFGPLPTESHTAGNKKDNITGNDGAATFSEQDDREDLDNAISLVGLFNTCVQRTSYSGVNAKGIYNRLKSLSPE